ncbi:hypothetical protein [Mesorhizobium sp. AA23]|uniref:hypothetical protein n=1 Tax=Mesorhizobium sp. AA23 TaxID=1854058 RepID=UPI000801C72E|nr:hypothetical protein [Mesorhizobium sp. AA23]OBQ89962.1 hypothetical protein A9K66_15045 [Mesorhizobium sp. AA23]
MNDLPPELLTVSQTPEYWSSRFRDKGLRMSARSLREKAIKTGLCYFVDRQVLISPRQID